jgi:prophage antirepressor-like protein
MNQLTPFQFHIHQVRTMLIGDNVQFIAADVAAALEYASAKDMVRAVDDEDQGWAEVPTLGGIQRMRVINESGIYSATFRSRKPSAKAFRRWVTAEVLPTIRRTGSYTAPPAVMPGQVERLQLSRMIAVISGELLRAKPERRQMLRYRKLGLSVSEIARLMRHSHETTRRELALLEACGLLETTPRLEAQRSNALRNLPPARKGGAS